MGLIEEEALFSQAIEHLKDERGAFLKEACADDLALRSGIEKLLNAYESDSTIFERPLVNPENLPAIMSILAGEVDGIE
jgi:hypothetical protein